MADALARTVRGITPVRFLRAGAPRMTDRYGDIDLPSGDGLRSVRRDGEIVWKLRCPGCGVWADLDDDQFHGRVSVDHTDTGCTYHETHNFHAMLITNVDEVITVVEANTTKGEPMNTQTYPLTGSWDTEPPITRDFSSREEAEAKLEGARNRPTRRDDPVSVACKDSDIAYWTGVLAGFDRARGRSDDEHDFPSNMPGDPDESY